MSGPERNPYLTTVSGREIDLVSPRWEDVDFRDVAHHLAHNCRYAGACRRTYTVAEHLLRGIGFCPPEFIPHWLAHDAHEAFSQDDATPKKRALPMVMREMMFGKAGESVIALASRVMQSAFDEFEARHMRAVHEAAGLTWPVPDVIEKHVKQLDRAMLATEWRDLMPGSPPPGYDIEPFAADFTRPLPFASFAALRDALHVSFIEYFPALRLRRQEAMAEARA